MRLSVKVAPGVRISGRIGGRRHHHHYRRRDGTWGTPVRRNGDWLHNVPPWRIPLPRVYGIGSLIGLMIIAEIGMIVWFYEFAAWLTVWFYYGLFLALRWCWRHNPIGQTIDSAAARRERQQPAPYDPHGAPQQYYDLGSLGNRGPVS